MADLEDIQEITANNAEAKETFVQHVFNFDKDTKVYLANVMQYTLLAIIPIVVLNKTIQNVFPVPDETKDNPEIIIEVIGQILAIFFGIIFIDRVITYIPTYSKVEYGFMNLFSVILPILVILLSLQTKVGQKVDILFNRLMNYYYGESITTEPMESKKQARKTAPSRKHQKSRADEYLEEDEETVVVRDARPKMPVPPRNMQSVQRQPGNQPVQDKPEFNNIYEPFVSGSGYAPF